jgi:hypothetical protein
LLSIIDPQAKSSKHNKPLSRTVVIIIAEAKPDEAKAAPAAELLPVMLSPPIFWMDLNKGDSWLGGRESGGT